MRRREKRDSYFARSLWQNLAVCALIALLMVPLCVSFYKTFRKERLDTVEASVGYMMSDLTSALDGLRGILAKATVNDSMLRLSRVSGAPSLSDFAAVRSAMSYVAMLRNSNNYLAELVTVFNKNDIVLTSLASFTSVEALMAYYSFEGFDIAAEIAARNVKNGICAISSHPALAVSCPDASLETAFCYCVPIDPVQAYGETFVFVRRDKLLASLPEVLLKYGKLTLRNGSGAAIFEYESEGWDARAELGAVKISVANAANTFSADAYLSGAALNALTGGMLRLIICYAAAVLLAALALALLSTKRQFRPLRALLGQLETYGYAPPTDKDEIAFVSESVEAIQAQRHDVAERLMSYRERLRDNQLERLLRGDELPDSDEYGLLGELPARYCVGYGYIDKPAESDEALVDALAIDRLVKALPGGAIVHMLRRDAFALILPAPDGLDALIGRLSGPLDALNESISRPLALAMSEAAEDARALREAFEQARMAALAAGGRAGLCRADEIGALGEPARLHTAMTLYQTLLAGNIDGAEELIRQLMRAQCEPFDGVGGLYEQCKAILGFAARDCDGDVPPPPGYEPSAAPSELIGRLLDCAEAICAAQNELARQQNSDKLAEALAYTRVNFADYDICARGVAERFRLPERAVQAFTHAETGMSFSNYVQSLRIERAAELLLNSEMPISSVATRCGYNTLSAFHKAFKRAYGIAPGEFRKRRG